MVDGRFCTIYISVVTEYRSPFSWYDVVGKLKELCYRGETRCGFKCHLYRIIILLLNLFVLNLNDRKHIFIRENFSSLFGLHFNFLFALITK